MPDDVIARIRPTPARRALALLMLFGLGGMLIYLALAAPPAHLGWQVFLLAVGAGALVLGERMRRATSKSVELTEEELRVSDGTVLARMEDIVGLDRGLFAFKPSNGFVVLVAEPGPAAWAPGLWWRIGRRIGIGGVTPSAEGKFAAELIAQHLARRDAG